MKKIINGNKIEIETTAKIKEVTDQEKKILETDLNDDKAVIDLIQNSESELYSGTYEDGETFTFGLQKGVGISISTYQSNGWIRINQYELIENEFGELEIERSESYEKE